MFENHRRPASRAGICASLVLLTGVASCVDKSLPSEPRQIPAIANDFSDNPSSPSPIIIRRDGLLLRVITVDAAQGIMAIHGPIDNPVCNNTTTRDPVDAQQISTPSDAQGIRLLIQATDTHVEIYAGTDITPVFPFVQSTFCAFVASTPTLYEGTARYSVNLGSAMASFRWEGDVTRTSDGAAFHYVESQDVVSSGNGNSNTTSSFIRLQQNGP
jgi:hypothetical protein